MQKLDPVRTEFQFRHRASKSVQRHSRADAATIRCLWHRIADGCCDTCAFYGGSHTVKLTAHRHLLLVLVSCTHIASFTAEVHSPSSLYGIASPEPAE